MQWVLQQIGAAFQAVFQVLIVKPIGYILTELAKAVFSIITALLNLTVFQPFTLHPAANGGNIVAGAAETVWAFMAALSVGVALVAFAWAGFTNTWGSIAGRSQFMHSAWADVLEGAGIWLLVLIGGYGFLSMLLDATNAVTTGLVHLAMNYQFQSVNAATVGAGVIGAILANWLWPSMLLVLAGFMIWAVVTWVMRMVDLVVFTGLLPLTAAFAITGNRQAWQWNWSEAMGAVFSQVAMAIMWWIAWLFIGGKLVHVSGSFGADLVRLLMGIAAMTLVAKAPQMLQSITGHRQAGVGGMMMAAAGGYMLGRAAMTAARATPLGQAAGKMTEAVTQRSQQRLNEWANRPGIGQGPLAKGAGAGMSRVAAAGKQVLGGALNTQTGQTLSGAAQGAWGVVQRAAPNLAAKTAVGASMTAQSVASGARSAARGASSAAGTVLQPSRTLGRAALHADARTFAARAANMDDDVPVQAGSLGMDRMVEQHPLVRGVEQNMRLAEARMMTAAPGSPEYKQAEANYNASRAEYQMASNAARLQIGEQVGRAPHGGNNRYREARAAARRRDVRPQPNSYV